MVTTSLELLTRSPSTEKILGGDDKTVMGELGTKTHGLHGIRRSTGIACGKTISIIDGEAEVQIKQTMVKVGRASQMRLRTLRRPGALALQSR